MTIHSIEILKKILIFLDPDFIMNTIKLSEAENKTCFDVFGFDTMR